MPQSGERAPLRGDAQALALTEELGAQLARMKGAGAKLVQLLSMLAFQREPSEGALGALRAGAAPVGFGRVRRIVEVELDGPVGELLSDFDEQPFVRGGARSAGDRAAARGRSRPLTGVRLHLSTDSIA